MSGYRLTRVLPHLEMVGMSLAVFTSSFSATITLSCEAFTKSQEHNGIYCNIWTYCAWYVILTDNKLELIQSKRQLVQANSTCYVIRTETLQYHTNTHKHTQTHTLQTPSKLARKGIMTFRLVKVLKPHASVHWPLPPPQAQ